MRAEGDLIEAERVRAEVRHRLFGGAAPKLTIGRFEIGERLGAGGMGVVYAGRDPDLARPVALKVLFADGDLRREAQALAMLRHPNVVSVHEIGTWQGRPFVAMELVEGETLRAWLSRKRTVAEIAAVFAGAGRGLAAAHAAGLVHRDFKLDNVIVDRDGQARVVDFGLARPAGDGEVLPRSRRLDAKGTTATAAGTPAYMAPEVLRGEPATARSDQFSFGVALYEALAGVRPYTARDVGELLAATATRPPRISGVPSLVTAMIERCLAPDPADRYPDLGPVISGLAPRGGGGSGIGKWIALGLLGAGVIVAVIVATRPDPQPAPALARCDDAGDELQRELTAQLSVIELAFTRLAQPTAFVHTEVVRYGERWRLGSRAACTAEIPETLKALRISCLDDRRRQLAAVLAQLAAPDPTLIDRVPQLLSSLPSVESCADTSLLAERLPLPQDPTIAKRITAARDLLAAARARFVAGKGPEAKAALDLLVPEVERLAYAPLTAEAELLVGNVTGAANDVATSRPALERAYREGIAGRHDPVAAEAAIRLAHLLGHVQAKPDEGRPWIANAEALLRRIGGTERVLEAQLRNVIGNVEQTAGHYGPAIAAFDKAEALWREAPGAHGIDLAQTLHNGGNARMLAGDGEAALAKLTAAKQLFETTLPAGHPYIGMTTGALTGALRDLGRHQEALDLDLPVLAAAIARHGANHPEVGFAEGAVANDYRGLGQWAEAMPHFERAGAIFTATFGPEHPTVSSTDSNVGACLLGAGRYPEAAARLGKALVAKEKRGAKHPSLISTLDNLGTLALRRGRPAEARRLFERSLAIGEEALGKDSSDVALTLASLGEAVLAGGDAKAARALLDRSLALRPKAPARELAQAKVALGRALWELGEHVAGRTLVEEQVRWLESPATGYEATQAKTWLAAHPR